MTPELLAYLTPEQRAAWDRCEALRNAQMEFSVSGTGQFGLFDAVDAMVKNASRDLPDALRTIAEQAEKLDNNRVECDGCGAVMVVLNSKPVMTTAEGDDLPVCGRCADVDASLVIVGLQMKLAVWEKWATTVQHSYDCSFRPKPCTEQCEGCTDACDFSPFRIEPTACDCHLARMPKPEARTIHDVMVGLTKDQPE